MFVDFSIHMKDTCIGKDYAIKEGAVRLHVLRTPIEKPRTGCKITVFQLLNNLNILWEHVQSITVNSFY